MALKKIEFFDQHFGSPDSSRTNVSYIEIVASYLTAEEIIASRVTSEWITAKELADKAPLTRRSFTSQIEVEATAFETVDHAVSAAHRAFKDRRYLFFWNDVQINKLNERLNVLKGNEALFLRIIPLQGG